MKRGWGVYPHPFVKATPAKGLESPRDFLFVTANS